MLALGPRGSTPPTLSRLGLTAYNAAVALAARGEMDIPFRSHVYGAADVRESLNVFHHGKCAFCETIILPVATPQVEHFRPKAGYVDEKNGSLIKPGYYRLAYEWSNLLLSCPSCNGRSNKGNRFPVFDEDHRRLNFRGDGHGERAKLIDPVLEEPRNFIRFRQGVAFAVGGNVRGEATIELLDLNRESLVDAREEHLQNVVDCLEGLAETTNPLRTDRLQVKLAQYLSKAGPYRSCVADFFSIEP